MLVLWEVAADIGCNHQRCRRSILVVPSFRLENSVQMLFYCKQVKMPSGAKIGQRRSENKRKFRERLKATRKIA